MALFKISKGNEANLPKLKRNGFAYFTEDESDFYIDIKDSDTDAAGNFIKDANGDPVGGIRKQLNANRARYLKSRDENVDGFHDLYVDDEEISLGRKKGEAYYENSFDGNPNGNKAGLRSIAVGNLASATGNYSSSFGSSTIASGINSHAEGSSAQATGEASHAEGIDTQATGDFSHAEGQTSYANGDASHAEGNSTTNGNYSHAEGYKTIADKEYSHAEGNTTKALGTASHAEGSNTQAKGVNAHAEGNGTIAEGYDSHAEGSSTIASGQDSHAEGATTEASGNYSHSEGLTTIASGDSAHAEGESSEASGYAAHAEGYMTTSSGEASHAEGNVTEATGDYSHAEGQSSKATNNYSHAEGNSTTASGQGAHSEGNATNATGDYGHAEGANTTAQGGMSHAEGSGSLASGLSSHAEGTSTKASGNSAHAEGKSSVASGSFSHAEGYNTEANKESAHAEGNQSKASGINSHAEGNSTVASGENSHAQNQGTIANGDAQTAIGKYNIADTTSAFIVGKGTADNARSNAFSIDWNGNAFVANLITQGAPSTDPSLANFNRFNNDLFIGGNGIQNIPTVAGVYIGKQISTENRQISIVSGGTTSYIDFNKSAGTIDYKVRLATNVETGKVEFLWDTNASNKELHVNGKLYLTQTPTNKNEATPKKYVDNFIKSVKEEFTGLTPYLVFTHGNNNTTRIQSDYRVLQSSMPSWDNLGSSKIPVLLSSPYKTVMNGGTNGTDITYWNDKFTFCPQTGYLEGVKIDCGAWEDYDSSVDDCCFEAGTQILVDLSGTTRNIEDMKPGDIAVAYDIQKGVNYLATVKDTHVKYDTTDIAEIVFNNGSKLTMNAYHPIYTTNGWHSLTNHKNYDTLIIGDVCRTESGWSEITDIQRYTSPNNIIMYSLDLIDIDETDDNDTNDNFFANGIVVHNAGCPV